MVALLHVRARGGLMTADDLLFVGIVLYIVVLPLVILLEPTPKEPPDAR